MKHLSIVLITLIGIFCLVQAAAAVTASGITTTPTQLNALKPGDIISEISGTLNLPKSGSETFDSDDSIEFYTQLDDARWNVAIVIGGIENPARTYGGKHVTIGGYDLAYPTQGYDSVALKFSMTGGTVPSSFNSGNIILVRAMEKDKQGDQVGSAVYVNGTVISTEALQANASAVLDDITALKADIDARAAEGIDVTLATQKYETAKTALQNAKSYLSSSPERVQGQIDVAKANIQAGQVALDYAWAQNSLDQAKAMLASVDGLITEFTVNNSLKQTDPRLAPIISKREFAAQTISSATDLFNAGSYTSAQGKAVEGYNLANQSWGLSLDLKKELGAGFQLPGLPNLGALLPILLVAAVILIVVGIVIYRRKMHWDELG